VNRKGVRPRGRAGLVGLLSANRDQSVEAIVDDHPGPLLRACLAGKCLARADNAALGHAAWDPPAEVPISLEERSAPPPTSRTSTAAGGSWIEACATPSSAGR
jgi:hypothetical protein